MTEVLVRRACAKLRSTIADEAVVRLNFTGDLQEMLDALEDIQQGLEEIDLRLFNSYYTWNWPQRVRMISYTIMDMIEELQDTRPPVAARMTRMLPRLAIIRNSMAIKVNVMKNNVIELKKFYDSDISKEEPVIIQEQPLMAERVSVPYFEEASAIGRGADKQRIVAMLLRAGSCIILPIFGLAGSGKTTLAQLVFNDNTHSLQEYNIRVWVHVSPELDFYGIGKSILHQVVSGGVEAEEIDDHGSNSDVVGMESIMKRLHELLNGKKVLLVLDDLWEEDSIQLQLLKSMLTFLGDKLDVIVTTCNQAIARKICTVVQPYRLNPLGDDTCWDIIKKSIRFEEEDGELENIGRMTASKCWGLPQAAVEYATMLVGSQDPKIWEEIMEKYLWYHTYFRSSPLLGYRSMPPELRLCFDYYCDIFPNSYNIVKDDLVCQWIALDFIEPSKRSSAIEIAEGYISRLLDMGFFQTAKSDPASGNNDNCPAMFTMHDLAHGFGSCMSQEEVTFMPCMLVTNYCGKLDYRNHDNLRALRCVGCSEVEFNDDSFSSQRSLRVLELKESSVQKLPDSIWQLRHLGYLKIAEFSGLVTLPESFGDLNNLFHIDLSGCSGLINLPESFGKLVLLVHMNLSGCSGLAVLPESFGDLMNLSHLNLSRCHGLAELPEPLQKLDKLVHLDLSFWSCFEGIGKGLGGLTNLEHLNLSNPCCHLAQQRSHLQELKDGLCKLTSLRYLNLSMCLNPMFYYMSEEDSLQYIESCVSSLSSLEHLDLSHNTFLFDLPESLGDLNWLHTLNLSGCIRLKKVCEMKSLKFIALRNCRGLVSCNFMVRFVDDDDVYSSSSIIQLEDVNCQELQISCLEKVKSREEARRIKLMQKKKLEKLKLSWTLDSIRSVEDSALLGELAPSPNVQCLEINGYDGTCLPEYLGDLTSLQELKIISCKQLNSLLDSIQKLIKLKNLCIFNCPKLEKWCQLEENKKMLAHIPNKNYEEHGSTSRPEIKEDGGSIDEVEAA